VNSENWFHDDEASTIGSNWTPFRWNMRGRIWSETFSCLPRGATSLRRKLVTPDICLFQDSRAAFHLHGWMSEKTVFSLAR